MIEGKPAPRSERSLIPGTLWERTVAQTQHALQSGALLTIPTDYEFVEQGGVRFLVRVLANLVRKDAANQQEQKSITTSGKDSNPFLPYEEDLFVADISETHVCLLNKFNVVDAHLLIITRKFEKQESLLNLHDFEAVGKCLAEIEGLVFYNAGKIAGASQPHKHLQLVPFPLTPEGLPLPIAPLFNSAVFQETTTPEGEVFRIATLPELPFAHAFMQIAPNWVNAPDQAAEVSLRCYSWLLQTIGLSNGLDEDGQLGAYNLLVTREWMLLVPRSQESFQSISVNSLGFAGTLFVQNQQQMQILKHYGPMMVLSQVGVQP